MSTASLPNQSTTVAAAKSCALKIILGFAMLIASKTAGAQDPTIPSPQILERLQSNTVLPQASLPRQNPIEQPAVPVIKLKAIVMRDENTGTALLEINGRKVRLPLVRNSPEQVAAPELAGIEIQGTLYSVEDFSSRSILLSGSGRKLLVN